MLYVLADMTQVQPGGNEARVQRQREVEFALRRSRIGEMFGKDGRAIEMRLFGPLDAVGDRVSIGRKRIIEALCGALQPPSTEQASGSSARTASAC